MASSTQTVCAVSASFAKALEYIKSESPSSEDNVRVIIYLI